MKDEWKSLHQQYIRSQRKQRFYIITTQLSILVFFFTLWEVSSLLKWINPLIFSQPSKVFDLLLRNLMDGSLAPHVWTTFLETVVGFLLGTIIGTLLATLLWWSKFLSKVLDPYLVVLNSMPKVALGPLFIVGLGPGFISIMAMALAITVIITTIVVYTRFKEVDPNYSKVIQTFGGKKANVYRSVILPASFPTIVSTLKVNVGLAWVGVIVGEFLVAKQGLGYLIIYGFQVFNFTLVLMSLLVIAIIATLMYQGVYYLEKFLIRSMS
ncbi:ABC transporter permease [Bacillus horti]|uniref:NitT/TauT family transport system permease protein n=1 Tax=Caldalkalibacillus horti TaxID=77523 RepID=A0ABT9VWZ0_9BACI|nr:ABC transporter permease [Bacillus horti]MDQ0165394.1 NitT/TauT family transport system permease protein [Bacillus horti]